MPLVSRKFWGMKGIAEMFCPGKPIPQISKRTNLRKTKISLQRNYEFIIKGFIQIKEEKLIPIFHYLNKIGIPILKIIVNGFIDNDFEDENQENLTLKMISNCINFCYNKNLLYFIYKKLSKYFRRHDKYKDLQSIKRFEKLFTIWKMLLLIN